jgi:glyoxylase-like metal-dependent hydrolase (beta-lactamase superfamily II)
MSETAYHLNIGEINCIIFSDGLIVDKTPEGIQSYGLNCIYIEAGGRKMLVDDGCGKIFQPETAGRLMKNLKSAGIKPEDMDTIIFSHGHIDHVSGTVNKTGKPVFTNARYIMTRKEWDFIKAPPGDNEMQNMFYRPARRFLLPLEERFTLVKDNYEVIPGIKMIHAYGHTPGNSMVAIAFHGERLFCICDVMHSPREFTDPGCLTMFDVIPQEAMKTRAKVLTSLAKDATLVFASHFTFPGLGYIRQKNGVFSWDPIKRPLINNITVVKRETS